MEIIFFVLLLLGLALASLRFGVDSRSGRDWSVGALLQPDRPGERTSGSDLTVGTTGAHRTAR